MGGVGGIEVCSAATLNCRSFFTTLYATMNIGIGEEVSGGPPRMMYIGLFKSDLQHVY